MRHILIQIDNDSLSLRKDGPFTPFQNTPFQKDIPSRVTGKILTKVLACLGTGSELEEVEADTQRTLKLHILIPRARTDGYTPTELEWEDRKMRADIRWYLRLLGEVKRRRKVDVVLDVVYQGVSVGKIDLEQLDLALD